MPTFLIIGQTASNPVVIDHVTAADLAAAELAVKNALASGISVGPGGARDTIQLGLIQLAATGTITPDANPANAVITVTDNYGWQTISKPADQTVTNNAVLQNDQDLQFAAAANTKYRARAVIFYDTTANGDFKYGISGPGSPTGVRCQRTHAIAGSAPTMVALDTAFPTNIALAGTGTTGGFIEFDLLLQNGANAGTVAFQFSQNTQTNDSGAVVRAGSYLEFGKA